jgi:8-oxo-dGTP pyrophosphatase MutT (NUDIX family)
MTRARAQEEVSAGGVVFRLAPTESGSAQALFLLIRDSYKNWGFPKGHVEADEVPERAAVREVSEETGIDRLDVRGVIQTIDWYFRFRGRLIHKVCHFYLMQSDSAATSPQRAEGITACRWAPFDEATRMVSYANARQVLRRAHEMLSDATHVAHAARDAGHAGEGGGHEPGAGTLDARGDVDADG